MSNPTVGIIGAGAAGTAAAKTLHTHGAGVEIELFTRSREAPINRTLVNKGVAIGLLEADQTALPSADARTSADTVRGIDPYTRRVHLDSGGSRRFDALIIATGSRPRFLDDKITGRDQALAASRLTTLHSLGDAVRVRDLLATVDHARILILGGGLIASETASLFTDAGHDTVLIARSVLPGARIVGEDVARRLLDLHHHHHAIHLGCVARAIRTYPNHITVVLDDGTHVEGDMAIVAHGTLPAAPAPWTGTEGIAVDSRLRILTTPVQRLYAAGGVAVHHYPGHNSYRIDHWDDAIAQGVHAAKALLHDLGLTNDPGTYLPTSTYSARIHSHTLVGAGCPANGLSAQIISLEPLLVAHRLGQTLVGLTGIDASRLLHEHAALLHQPIPSHFRPTQ